MSKSSFQFINADEISQAKEVCHLDHVSVCRNTVLAGRRALHKSGCESHSVCWAPDQSYLAWSAGHRMIHLIPWDAKNQKKQDPNDSVGLAGREFHIIECGEVVHSMTFGLAASPVNSQRWKSKRPRHSTALVLATGHPSGRIKLWNCETGALLLEIMDHREVVHDLHFKPDGSLKLSSASRDGTVKLWEFDAAGDCNLYLTIKTGAKHALSCKWSPSRNHLATVGTFKHVMLFKLKDRQILSRLKLEGHHNDVVACDFSPDGALLATASYDSRVIIWDVDTRAPVAELCHLFPKPGLIFAGGSNDHYVFSVKFSPDGSRLATTGEDGFVRVWELPDTSDPETVAAVDGGLCCSFSPDGQLLAVGTNTGSTSVLAMPRDGVDSLMHACRKAIRRTVSSASLKMLPVPPMLQEYLAYKDVGPYTGK